MCDYFDFFSFVTQHSFLTESCLRGFFLTYRIRNASAKMGQITCHICLCI